MTAPATLEDVERQASLYILHKLGDRLWAGDPIHDQEKKNWIVPIHSTSLPPGVVLGKLLLNEEARVVEAPSRRELQRAVEEHEAVKPADLSPLTLAFAMARGADLATLARHPEVVPRLLEALRDEDSIIRIRATKALVSIGAPQAADQLAELLVNDPDGDVRAAAAKALGAIGDLRAVASLTASLEDAEATVKHEAAAALALMGQAAATPRVLEEVVEAILQELRDRPQLAAAFVNLRVALSDPDMQPHVLGALDAFARAARRSEDEGR